MSNTKPTQPKETCIRCGKPDKVIRRGLCQSHYGEFRTAKSHVDDSEMELWEASLVARGLLLPDARKASNPYIDTLAELRALTNATPAAEIPSASDEAAADPLHSTPVGRKKSDKKKSAPAESAGQSKRKKKSG